ncbi:phage major head subunit gpT-like protein [Pseudarthrobacter oxydans]|uniref:Phage major head subunit gpT-like protein n=1 Tax=Pseudarthrobacter oxydans TaxID=1671 RepID=A0AAW8NJG5_PSEOX|nr:Mu-like prophage major head subunit gpT family protein [Pseudarthrobacter oxydans]MDR6794730.1 phage major head subunit gpT-like protein [Pseudarthrobacter oxydans]MDR7166068.1 phage major head subunit gpT-like protein [Pseudarthrobacter oxydans]
MSVITRELLQALDTNIKVTWQKRFEGAPTADLWKKIAMPINSKSLSEKYSFLGTVPGLREFKSERIPGTLSGFNYEITNKKWESTLDVDRDVIEDDNTGQIMLAVTGLATKAAKHYTVLTAKAFDYGFTTPIYDGQNFFDADHTTGSNYLGTAKDLNATNVEAAELLLNKQVDDRGEYLGHMGTAIICGPELAAAANKLVNSRTIEVNGAALDNPNYKRYEIVVLPHLGTSKKWAVADLSQGLLPFIVQIRVAISLVAKTDLNSDRAFDKDIFTWGTRARHNVGYGNHQLIVGAIAS